MLKLKSYVFVVLCAASSVALTGCGGGSSKAPVKSVPAAGPSAGPSGKPVVVVKPTPTPKPTVIVVITPPSCDPTYQCCDGVGDCGVIIVDGSSSGSSVGSSTGSSTGSSAGSSTGSGYGSSTGSSTGSSSGSYGSSTGSSSGSYGSSSGSYGSSTGSSSGSDGSYGSSTGSSDGSSDGSYDDGYATAKTGGNGTAATCSTVEECAAQAQAFNQAANGLANAEGAPQASISDSIGGGTADVDQQQAQAAEQDQASRAQTLANSFQMDYGKALQLTQLSDQVKNMTANGQMTDEDRAAITDQALGVAQISSEEVNEAAADAIKNGDNTKVNALVEKAATNLGMPSNQELKDQLLPALGLQF